jgi:hypothetical protein
MMSPIGRYITPPDGEGAHWIPCGTTVIFETPIQIFAEGSGRRPNASPLFKR